MADQERDLVYGGGDAGLMGAVSRAHGGGKAKTVGIIPKAIEPMVPHRDRVELIVTEDMHRRKALMYEKSQGFIALPGGIGTMEELFEVLTWNQLGYLDKPVGLLNTRGFFDGLLVFLDAMTEKGFLRKTHRDRLLVDQDPADLLEKMDCYTGGYEAKWG